MTTRTLDAERLPAPRAMAYQRVEAALSLPMLILALLILPLLLIPMACPGLPHDAREAVRALDLFIWVAFTVEYLLLLSLAANRWQHFRTHLFELTLVVLP